MRLSSLWELLGITDNLSYACDSAGCTCLNYLLQGANSDELAAILHG